MKSFKVLVLLGMLAARGALADPVIHKVSGDLNEFGLADEIAKLEQSHLKVIDIQQDDSSRSTILTTESADAASGKPTIVACSDGPAELLGVMELSCAKSYPSVKGNVEVNGYAYLNGAVWQVSLIRTAK